MRKVSMAAFLGLLLGAQGCNITIPAGLINTAGKPGGGTVSGTEDCRALFFKYDLNGDKVLTEDEYVKGRGGNVPAAAKAPGADERKGLMSLEDDLRAGFKALDADASGTVSLEEFLASCQGDRDGAVDETGGHPGIDDKTNIRPGVMPPYEGRMPWIWGVDCATSFKIHDTNGDGKWSREEYQVWVGKMTVPAADCAPPPTEPLPKPVPMPEPMPVEVDDTVGVANDGGMTSADGTVGSGIAHPIAPACPAPMPHPTFEDLDLDADGAIGAAEFCEYFGNPGVQPPPPLPGDDCESTFRRADANGDGAVSFDEYSQADYKKPLPEGMMAPAVMPSPEELKRRFVSLDRNQDGKLDAREFCASWYQEPPVPGDDCKLRFNSYDRDGDHKLTWEEYFTSAEAMRDMIAAPAEFKDGEYQKFKGYDRNGDGVVTPEEFCGFEPAPVPATGDCEGEYRAFDKDQSGALTYDEYAAGRYGQMRFVKAPTQEEAARLIYDFKARAKQLDANQDQKLTYEEFKQSCVQ